MASLPHHPTASTTDLTGWLVPLVTGDTLLATMLWLTMVRKHGIDITTVQYLRISLVTVPIVLLTTSVTLWLVVR